MYKKSQQPVSSGISSPIRVVPLGINAKLVPDVGPEGVSNGEDSTIVLHDNTRDQQLHVSGASTSAPGHADDVTPAGEWERIQEVPASVLDSHNVPDLSRIEREAKQDQQTDAELPERAIDSVTITVNEARRGFGPLKVVLSSIYTDYKGTTVIENKIEDLLLRVDALENHFDSRPGNAVEVRRRTEVMRKLEDIKGGLQLLWERLRENKLAADSQDDEDIFKLLENIRETVFDYQMEQQKEFYNHQHKPINQAEATVLNNFRCAQGAEFRHGERNGCLKGTRVAVLDEIELWTRNFAKPPVYWLNGIAGTGKTAIAQTIAERAFADGWLGASFFCSRDFEDRSNLHFIFPTLAVQLARKYSDFRLLFVPLARSDPGIAHESLYNQMHKLIVQPLKESDISTVIIIDALDECRDEEPASAILSVLGQFVSEIPKVKLLVTGRPELRIQEGFCLPLLAEMTSVFVLHEVEPNQVDNDIQLFFGHKFSEIARRRRGLDGWPTREQLDILYKRAAGLFVYAVATVKFVDKSSGNPRNQLNLLLQSPESSVREGRTKLNANTTLNSLYTTILQGAFGDEDDPDNDPKVRSVLGAMILAANPLSPSTIAALLDLDTEDVIPILSSIQSLLILQEDINCPVQPFHKSFPDFITNPDRCTNRRFLIFPGNYHPQLLVDCLRLMDRTLEKNMCRLPEAVANSDVSDVKERIERYISTALQYACRWWHTHLVDQHIPSINTHKITSALHRFLERKFLFWLEVLSVLGAVRNAAEALRATVGWLEESPTLDLANDCHRFVAAYFEIIHASAPHVYHSALVLAPKTSIVRKLYESHTQHLVRIVCGVQESWDLNTAATTFPFRVAAAVWSQCNRFIAISRWDTIGVDILDSVTLQRLQSLGSPWKFLTCDPVLIFSPDSRMLTYSGYSAVKWDARTVGQGSEILVVTWDLQTGGVVSAVAWERSSHRDLREPLMTYSMDGKVVAILSRAFTGRTIISIVDVVSGVYMHNIDCHQPDCFYICNIWTHGGSINFVAIGLTRIVLWEVEFTQGAMPMEVKSLSVPEDEDLVYFKYLPVLNRVACASADRVLVWDAQDSKSLLHHVDIYKDPLMTFSSDGHFFACSTARSEIYLWRESPVGYELHSKLSPSGKCPMPLISPNGESIITFGSPIVQLWHMNSSIIIPSNSLVQFSQNNEEFILDFLPNRSLAVVAQKKDNIVTVLNLKSGIPWLTIDTSMQVYGLGVNENGIVTIGCERVITWNLPGRNSLPGVRLNIGDSTQIIQLRNGNPFGSWPLNLTVASISLDFRYIALFEKFGVGVLWIYNTYTGLYYLWGLATLWGTPWFSPDDEIWCPVGGKKAEVWKITENELVHRKVVHDIDNGLWGCPWGSSCGYQVVNDGWILGPDGKRLLMLPPPWQSNVLHQVWNGQFLALLHATLPEPVIIELEL